MAYSIVGTGNIGKTLTTYFAKAKIVVALANTRGAEAVEPIAKKLGGTVAATSLDEALRADIIFVAVPFLNFKDVGSLKPDWTGKIVIDVTNAFMLPADVQKAELNGRLSSEVNVDRVPGAKLVKAFNTLPWQVLASPVPAGGKRVVFISSDHQDASERVAAWRKTLGLLRSKLARLARAGASSKRRTHWCFRISSGSRRIEQIQLWLA